MLVDVKINNHIYQIEEQELIPLVIDKIIKNDPYYIIDNFEKYINNDTAFIEENNNLSEDHLNYLLKNHYDDYIKLVKQYYCLTPESIEHIFYNDINLFFELTVYIDKYKYNYDDDKSTIFQHKIIEKFINKLIKEKKYDDIIKICEYDKLNILYHYHYHCFKNKKKIINIYYTKAHIDHKIFDNIIETSGNYDLYENRICEDKLYQKKYILKIFKNPNFVKHSLNFIYKTYIKDLYCNGIKDNWPPWVIKQYRFIYGIQIPKIINSKYYDNNITKLIYIYY